MHYVSIAAVVRVDVRHDENGLVDGRVEVTGCVRAIYFRSLGDVELQTSVLVSDLIGG